MKALHINQLFSRIVEEQKRNKDESDSDSDWESPQPMPDPDPTKTIASVPVLQTVGQNVTSTGPKTWTRADSERVVASNEAVAKPTPASKVKCSAPVLQTVGQNETSTGPKTCTRADSERVVASSEAVAKPGPAAVVKCSRCSGTNHLAAACTRKTFLRPTCTLCLRGGHQREECPRDPEYKKTRQEEYKKYLERKARREAVEADKDCRSDCSTRTASTAATDFADKLARKTKNMAKEDKKVKKAQKLLREIEKLVERRVAGEVLETLQLEKIRRKVDVEVELETAMGLVAARARNALKYR